MTTPSFGARFPSTLHSPLVGVSDAAWARFVMALDVQPMGAVSKSGGFGSYDFRPRRLVDLGYATGLKCVRTPAGRQIYTCRFVFPWTQERFLQDPLVQYDALAKSIKNHYRDLSDGTVKQPEGLSLAGALVILHRGGRGALKSWPRLFDHTRALYMGARGAF